MKIIWNKLPALSFPKLVASTLFEVRPQQNIFISKTRSVWLSSHIHYLNFYQNEGSRPLIGRHFGMRHFSPSECDFRHSLFS
jgi:hypothetical protein